MDHGSTRSCPELARPLPWKPGSDIIIIQQINIIMGSEERVNDRGMPRREKKHGDGAHYYRTITMIIDGHALSIRASRHASRPRTELGRHDVT